MQVTRYSLETKIAQLTADLNKKIAADNRAFARMSRKRQRVAIAQDVLASLKAGLFKAVRGTYLQKKERATGTRCDVCAIGSMFAACSLRTGAADDVEGLGNAPWSAHSDMYEALAKYFDSTELGLIEAAFERDTGFANEADDKLAIKAGKFTRGLNAERALEKIMKNIIANDGDFTLEA